MSDGFLGRWSRRKQEVREGKPVAEPAPDAARTAPSVALAPVTAQQAASSDAGVTPVEAPPPTLEDTRVLTPTSDFKPFMAQGVTADVRNAAVKKLFADPHFNVMDRLDIYIDDYSQPDPLPAAMLRQMVSAKFLNLFDDAEEAAAKPAAAGDDADTGVAQDVAQSGLAPELPAPPPPADAVNPGTAAASTEPEDAHTDLRLQPDDAPQRESAGPGPA